MKFSIIIPVYNVEKYIRKCLESILNQSFDDYEVIIVNDGSPDNSQNIINEYVEKNPNKFKSFIKENGGLSDARNYGVEKASGEYIVFIDGDDYIENNFLEEIYKKINKKEDIDLIRIPIKQVSENGEILEVENLENSNLSGEELFIYLRKKRYCIEPAWSYIIKKQFWAENNFKFPLKKIHEDFATMLLVVLKAKNTKVLNTTYYNYVVRENSIMTSNSYEKNLKRVYDKLEHFDNIKNSLEKEENISKKAKECCLEYISTSACIGIKKLSGQDKKIYKKEIRKRKVIKNFKCDSLRNMFRKLVFIFWIYC